MIYTLFVIFIVIASLLMIGIVLIQESKGGGLASNFSDRKSTRLNSSHSGESRMPSSA